jgi:hypothetical protein
MVKFHLPTSEISLIGSLKYRLYTANSPIDIQIIDFSYEEKSKLQSSLLHALSSLGRSELQSNYIKFIYECEFHIYFYSEIPLITAQLISRYVEEENITSFLVYIKIWAKEFNLAGLQNPGFFWTLLGLFFLTNSKYAVMPNLLKPEIHRPVSMEGLDVWTNPQSFKPADTPAAELFVNFLRFLNESFGKIANNRTGEIYDDQEYFLGVSDLFTSENLGVLAKDSENFRQALRKKYKELRHLVKL